MKILWFTNTPCSASEKLMPNSNMGGWLSSLEKEISQNSGIELNVAFYFTSKINPFKFNNTTFYPIKRKYTGSKIQRYFFRLLGLENNDKNDINQLLSIIDEVKPDIIHIHGTEENFGLIQTKTTIPIIISIQGIVSPIVEKFYSGIPYSIANKFEKFKNKILLKTTKYNYNTFNKWSERELNILTISKNIIGRTDWDRRVTRILSPKSTYYIGQEILRPSFYKGTWNKQSFNEKIRIVTISSDGLYKGFETIIKTANILSHSTDLDFEWIVIGLNKASRVVELTQNWLKIEHNSINVVLVGKKNEIEIVDILLSSDIYCQVSHIENSPNSLCEAMLVGIPIIATVAGGTSSLITDKKEGLLVQEGEPYSYAGAIIELTENFALSSLYGKSARECALKRHNKQNIINDLIITYKSLIK